MHESEKWTWSRSVLSDPQRPHGLQPSKLLRPWDFPDKSTGVGCHCLLHLTRAEAWFPKPLKNHLPCKNTHPHKIFCKGLVSKTVCCLRYPWCDDHSFNSATCNVTGRMALIGCLVLVLNGLEIKSGPHHREFKLYYPGTHLWAYTCECYPCLLTCSGWPSFRLWAAGRWQRRQDNAAAWSCPVLSTHVIIDQEAVIVEESSKLKCVNQ